MTHLYMADKWTCPCQIAKAQVGDQEIVSDQLLQTLQQALRVNDYATITITLPLLNRDGYQLYPKKPLTGNTPHLEYWKAYICWLDGTTMVFVPESHGTGYGMNDVVNGLLFTQEAYNRLCLRHEGVKAEQWYRITDYGLDIQIEPVDVYVATPLSVFDGTNWCDREGTYQTNTYFSRYDDAYTYVCGMYDSMISTLQARLQSARISYVQFHNKALARTAA